MIEGPLQNGDRSLLGRVTDRMTGRVVETIHPDIILDHVDVDAIVRRIDVNNVVQRIDMDALLDRVDIGLLLDRVDVERVLSRIDLEAVVRRSGVPEIVAQSTGQMAGSALDVGRRQLVGLDALIERLADRLFRRTRTDESTRPQLLRGLDGDQQLVTGPDTSATSVTGHYAGPVNRAAAAGLDVLVVMAVFTVAYAGAGLLVDAFFNADLEGKWSGVISAVALSCWGFAYYFVSLAVAGRTTGKALVGLRVLSRSGAPLGVAAAFVRTLALPLSALFFGLGFVPIVLQRHHRGLHDYLAGTVVVYDWGARTAQLPAPLSQFLSRHGS